jgi:hypothetical protein
MGSTKRPAWPGIFRYDEISTATETDTTSPLEKHTTTVTQKPGKTLWDGLQLLIIPVALALAVAWLNMQQNQASLQVSQQQYQTSLKITQDQERATTLTTYIDNMSDLLLNHKLRESQPTDEVQVVARARTLSALGELDPKRKGTLLTFLYEAKLINYGSAIISLKGANLFETDLSVSGADLSRADLRGANLQGATLNGTDLFETDLSDANLEGANLRNANLTGVIWRNTICPDGTNSDADGGSCMGHI